MTGGVRNAGFDHPELTPLAATEGTDPFRSVVCDKLSNQPDTQGRQGCNVKITGTLIVRGIGTQVVDHGLLRH